MVSRAEMMQIYNGDKGSNTTSKMSQDQIKEAYNIVKNPLAPTPGMTYPFEQLIAGGEQLLGKVTGSDFLKEDARKRALGSQQQYDTFASEHPYQALGGELFSSMLMGGGAMSIPRQMGLAAATTGLSYTDEGQSRLSNAGISGAMTGIFGKAGNLVGEGFDWAAKKADPYAQAMGFKSLGNFIGNEQEGILGKFKEAEAQRLIPENKAWNETREMAETADILAAERRDMIENGALSPEDQEMYESISDFSFDEKGFKNQLFQRKKFYENKINKTPSLGGKYQENIDLLDTIMKDDVSSWQNAVDERQALNLLYGTEITPGKPLPESEITYALGALNRNIKDNLKRSNMPAFEEAWKSANSMTKSRKQSFDTMTSPSGRIQKSPYSLFKQGKDEFAPSEHVLDPYIPKSATDSTQRLGQLESILGKEEAQAAANPRYFRDAIDEETVDPEQFFSRYKKLSNSQKDWMFDKTDRSNLDEIYKQYKENPLAFKENKEGSHSFYEFLTREAKKLAKQTSPKTLGLYRSPQAQQMMSIFGRIPYAATQTYYRPGAYE